MKASIEGIAYLVVTGCCRVNFVCTYDFFVCVVSVIDTDLCLVSVVLCVELALCVDVGLGFPGDGHDGRGAERR